MWYWLVTTVAKHTLLCYIINLVLVIINIVFVKISQIQPNVFAWIVFTLVFSIINALYSFTLAICLHVAGKWKEQQRIAQSEQEVRDARDRYLHLQGEKSKTTVPVKVSPVQILHDPAAYHLRLIEVEGVVKKVFRHVGSIRLLQIEYVVLYVMWSGTPTVAKGDQVRVAGLFTHNGGLLEPLLIEVGRMGKIEKI